MKTAVFSLALALCLGATILSRSSAIQNVGGSEKAREIDLSGVWDGTNHRNRNDDWGQVHLKATSAGYIGTYSDTFNRQLGSATFRSLGGGRHEGLWWESDLKRYGSWQLELSNDGRSILVHWTAISEGGAKSGKSTLKR